MAAPRSRFTPAEIDARRMALPRPNFLAELPVSARRSEISAAISANQVVIVCGETGSGKTTQLPKICLEMGRGISGTIGHTQPRRIAARATAARIAQELGVELGGAVGFKIRFTDRVSPRSYVKLMTDGILLAETQGDPALSQYDTLIIDEAHERSLNIDFLLGYLKTLLPRRPDLKVIVTSATLDAERLAHHFSDREGQSAPVIEVSGRLYPVEVRYRPLRAPAGDRMRAPRQDADEVDLNQAIADAVDELARGGLAGARDVLVFLPGEREIREAAEALRKHHPPQTEILPLYARLSAADQERVFKPHSGRRIVLATNVAETSLTVPGIRYVVDSGLARVKRYSYRNKVEQLHVEPVSQAAARQRAGRCGRLVDGVCIRLYAEAEFAQRPLYTDPELLRSSLASVILRMKALGLGEPDAFPFVDPPAPRAVADGYALLAELNAVDEQKSLTQTGRQLARLPLDPRIGRMILAGKAEGCLAEVLVIAAALSVQDPRERPLERAQAADEAHKKFVDDKSDFLSLLKMWKFFEEALAHRKSGRKLREACRSNFLSFNRMREWRDIHAQLKELVSEMGWRVGGFASGFAQIHRALLAGLLGNIGLKSEDGHYLGARGIKFWVHPGSGLGKKTGKWVMAAELTETTRLYARSVSGIDPGWLESVGAHLVRRHQFDPHWEKKPAHVAAFESGTIYGLPLYAKRRVHYGPLDPGLARDLFIRGALVGGDWDSRAPFFVHNRKLVHDIELLEHKSRRPDVLVDDELIFSFYDSVVPRGRDIHNGAAFDAWRREAEKDNPRLLFLRREDLMRHEAAGITTTQFPHKLEVAGRSFALEYRHEPGSARDGVTITVPLVALNQVNAAVCDWLVPGLRREKVIALAKSLPQRLRHKLGPLREFADAVLAAEQPGESTLVQAIARCARRERGVEIPPDAFRPEALPVHLAMNIRVVDEHGRQLGMGRGLAQLRAELGQEAGQQFAQAMHGEAPAQMYTGWDFGDLAEVMEVERGPQTLVGYPALVDRGEAVSVELLDSAEKAREMTRAGLRRLFMLQLKEQAKFVQKSLPGFTGLALQFAAFGDAAELKSQLLAAAFDCACLADPLPRTRADFERRCSEGRSRLALIANELARHIGAILAEHAALQKKLQQAGKAYPEPCRDIRENVESLLPPRFIAELPFERLQHLPRYLKAAGLRLDRLRTQGDAAAARDARVAAELAPLLARWQREEAKRQRSGERDPHMEQFRWLLEELRVQLFAQELKTPVPVSVKRLQKMWSAIQR